ncbi:malto-oligosyltrehalose synthase, partial [Streptomyces sp. SID14478]|nr:malto-oligosyltrehalose synthase [Streptomyces sp. SID14478]
VDTVRDLALGRHGDGPAHRAFRARFAQTASALRAKSVEDTAFYRHTPLLSALEVGGCPHDPAVSAGDFHAYCARVQRDWPYTSTVLSTHDTKRSADVRAGIAVLTQCPDHWETLLAQVTERTAHGGGTSSPDPQLAWAAWQTVAGLGPAEPERMQQALLKHAREAGLFTTWTEQNTAYEGALRDFVASGPCGPPGDAVLRFMEELAPHVGANVLGAALVHLTMPGVPDLYQGTEHEYRALVDPDNREPARFDVKGRGALSEEKAALTKAALRLRREHPEWFGGSATYAPLSVEGSGAGHCVAYARSGRVVVAVTRLSLRLAEAGGWRETELVLPEGEWTELLDPERQFSGHARVADLFRRLPVALLVRAEDGAAGLSAGVREGRRERG